MMDGKQEARLRNFFNNVMIVLNYYDWRIEFTTDSYCWINMKLITVNKDCVDIYQMILHEIAHIGICRFCNQKHNSTFWKHFEDLLYRFCARAKMCGKQINHKRYMTKGIYRKIYDDKNER